MHLHGEVHLFFLQLQRDTCRSIDALNNGGAFTSVSLASLNATCAVRPEQQPARKKGNDVKKEHRAFLLINPNSGAGAGHIFL